MKRMLLVWILAVALATPFAVSAVTPADLQGQIKELLAKVAQLQQRLAQMQGSSTVASTTPRVDSGPKHRICNMLMRSLATNDQGEDVTALQSFLKDNGFFSEGATGFFGPATQAALRSWQASQGIVSSGDAFSTGWGRVGPKTRDHIKRWCGIGGNEFRFAAEPQKGSAPLVVTFSAWVGGFTPYRYAVDFGDGSGEQSIACSAPADACVSAGTVTHTYQSNGTYTAVLYRVLANTASTSREALAKESIHVGEGDTGISCTKEYKPVCGQPSGCANTCPPGSFCALLCQLHQPTTYGNKCTLEAAGAQFLYEGACKATTTTPFEPASTCKSWYDGCNSCSREAPGGPAMCTLRACLNHAPGYCTASFDGAANNRPPVISSFSGPTTLAVNQTGTWNVAASDPENGTLTYSIEWGDVYRPWAWISSSAAMAREFVQSTTFDHVYTYPGEYKVTIVVQDTAGATTRTTTTVRVGSSDPVVCTMEYAPVCASKQVQCITTPCNPVQQTYGNRCQMKADSATFVHEGACTTQ